ncbi:uncharacterized protein [Dermacentor albipictus]|uniref:uncharacterized protein n=1 Tax=Dermacentor albipictus TaxID=60249 RepID=UPI0038FD3400
MKRLSSTKNLKVNEHRCIVVDPANQAVRLKLHWMLHNVSDEDIRTALLPFGKVTDVFHEKWRVQGVQDKASSTRVVSLVLKTGMTIEDLPHQLRVAGPALREDVADLLMDEADVDEASRVLVPPADTVATPSVPAAKSTKVVNVLPTGPKDAVQRACDEGAKEESVAKSTAAEETATEHGPVTSLMDVEESSASNAAMKRARDSTGNLDGNLDNGAKDEPPPKAQAGRRVPVRLKPNIPPDRRPAAKPPK